MNRILGQPKRRGSVAIWAAVSGVMLTGFAALAVDVGYMYSVRGELQRTADAAALAGASQLATGATRTEGENNSSTAARLTGAENRADRLAVNITTSDITFGTYTTDHSTGKYTFVENTSGDLAAIRVTARRENMGLLFSRVLGLMETDLKATATAILLPRDISVVIDLSGSMKHDSYLRFYNQTQINARDIWCALDGPPPSRPYTPGAENETEYASDTGPTIGVMDTWGDPITPTGYDPTTDPGLWYLPRGSACNISAIHSKLSGRGYSSSEIDVITGSTSNTDEWKRRTAVMIGLAEWNRNGSSDSSVSSGELSWISYPSYRLDWEWMDYIDWTSESASKLTRVHPQYQYRYGVKTYTDFLLDRRDHGSQTDLTKTPEEPLTAVKDAVQQLVDDTGVLDHMSLETFGSDPKHEVDLSSDRQEVADTLYARQANHWSNSTNIGGGLQYAVNELSSSRARNAVKKVIVLMSDGANKTGPDPVTVAEDAASKGMIVYTVSVGYGVDRPLMQQIATTTGGEEFYAAGSSATYSAQLRSIFRTIGGRRPIVLID